MSVHNTLIVKCILIICGKYHYVCVSKGHMVPLAASDSCFSILVTASHSLEFTYTYRPSYTCYPPIALMTMTREDWENSPADKVHFVLDPSV